MERMEEVEDKWLAEQAWETLKNIESGKEKVIFWDEMASRLSKSSKKSRREDDRGHQSSRDTDPD